MNPPVSPSLIQSLLNSNSTRAKSHELAASALRANITEIVQNGKSYQLLLTGGRQFKCLWARDFSFAAAGALALGMDRAVHDSIDLFFKLQRDDGLLPRLIDGATFGFKTRFALTYLGLTPEFRGPVAPNYISEHGIITVDGNVLLPWAASLYLEKTKDTEAGLAWWPKALKALRFLEEQYLVDGLISKQPKYADWADSVARTGRVSFVNSWYVICLRALAQWAQWLKLPEADELQQKASRANTYFRNFFWDSQQSRIRNFETDERLVLDANLLTVIHELVSPPECEQILQTLRASPLWHPIPGRVTHPAYPKELKSWTTRTVGLGDYHDHLYWIWLAAHAGRAEAINGSLNSANAILDQVAELIVKWNGIHEVYELEPKSTQEGSNPSLRPVRRFLYRAEVPFTWSAATFVEMFATVTTLSSRSQSGSESKAA
jgi:hypothetical protein